MSTDDTSTAKPGRVWLQFSVTSILWLTATVGMVLAYLRAFEASEVWHGLIAVAVGLVVGLVTAALSHRPADAIFWSLIGTMATFLCAAGYEMDTPAFHYSWILVGAVSGASAGVVSAGQPVSRMLVGGFAGGSTLAVFAAALPQSVAHSLLSVGVILICVACIGGALLGGVIEAICWIESRRNLPRYITTAALLFAVIAGNIAAKFFIQGW